MGLKKYLTDKETNNELLEGALADIWKKSLEETRDILYHECLNGVRARCKFQGFSGNLNMKIGEKDIDYSVKFGLYVNDKIVKSIYTHWNMDGKDINSSISMDTVMERARVLSRRLSDLSRDNNFGCMNPQDIVYPNFTGWLRDCEKEIDIRKVMEESKRTIVLSRADSIVHRVKKYTNSTNSDTSISKVSTSFDIDFDDREGDLLRLQICWDFIVCGHKYSAQCDLYANVEDSDSHKKLIPKLQELDREVKVYLEEIKGYEGLIRYEKVKREHKTNVRENFDYESFLD